MFKKAAAFLLSAVIMAGASTVSFAESTTQTVTVEQEYGASATKTWDGKSEMKAGQKYVLKKSVTISTKVTLPKGATLTLNKGVKLGISAKGTFNVKGKLAIKSGATLTVSGKLVTYSGSTVSDSGTIKLTSNKASVTIGGTFTINKGGKLTGAPKSLKLGTKAKVTVNGTNSCKKLQQLLTTETEDKPVADDTKDSDADKAEIEKLINTYMKQALSGDIYGAICAIYPKSYVDKMDKEIQDAFGTTLEEFYNGFFMELMKANGITDDDLAKLADSVNMKVTKLTDCTNDLSDNQKEVLDGCGKITKAYNVKVSTDVDDSVLDMSGVTINDSTELTAVYAGGHWYIIGI